MYCTTLYPWDEAVLVMVDALGSFLNIRGGFEYFHFGGGLKLLLLLVCLEFSSQCVGDIGDDSVTSFVSFHFSKLQTHLVIGIKKTALFNSCCITLHGKWFMSGSGLFYSKPEH